MGWVVGERERKEGSLSVLLCNGDELVMAKGQVFLDCVHFASVALFLIALGTFCLGDV